MICQRRRVAALPEWFVVTRDLEAALRLVIESLDGLKLRYALVGGLAVSTWAWPRSTRDVDLWAALPDERLPELEHALMADGFEVPAMVDELRQFGVFRSRHRESGVFVDIFDATGPLGEALLDRRLSGQLGQTRVWLSSPEDLAVLKAFSDRDRDFDDLVLLLSVVDLDRDYVLEWARRLDQSIGTEEVVARVRSAISKAGLQFDRT
ncbi:MAG: hypothetical protein AUK47_14920 [Deltaproteobacteria bacterium CG2_30_63_29]|nr:MAG: hypothetical protein AUK47_14920 [Deltaproteobacteria bacterium CG2_30_63_29]